MFPPGLNRLGSSRLPTLIERNSECAAFSANSGVPHSGQKQRATRLPFSDRLQ
jgi:hypothetical protein